jgi:hypothetical protein
MFLLRRGLVKLERGPVVQIDLWQLTREEQKAASHGATHALGEEELVVFV